MDTKTGCLVCGKPIVYSLKNAAYTCSLCGGLFKANAVCEEGHYVCDKCHSSAQEGGFLALLRTTDEKDPGEIFRQVASLECVHMHGPEHHSIVPCVMIAAFRNNGGEVDFEEALEEAAERGGQIPGGVCGSWGACGAAIGSGVFASVMADLTPYKEDGWDAAQRLTARCLEKIAAVGGPRCCKRTSRISIAACVVFAKERYGVEMPLEDYRCTHYAINEECIQERCPYY